MQQHAAAQEQPPSAGGGGGGGGAACLGGRARGLPWVPPDALACVQDFYISQGLSRRVPWANVRGVLVRLDAAYVRRERAALQRQAAVHASEVEALRRRAGAARSAPAAVASQKAAVLRRQLAGARRALAAREGHAQAAVLQVGAGACELGRPGRG